MPVEEGWIPSGPVLFVGILQVSGFEIFNFSKFFSIKDPAESIAIGLMKFMSGSDPEPTFLGKHLVKASAKFRPTPPGDNFVETSFEAPYF